MRHIIECEDPTDIILAMKSIKDMIEKGHTHCVYMFENGTVWVARKTKTGFSVRQTK